MVVSVRHIVMGGVGSAMRMVKLVATKEIKEAEVVVGGGGGGWWR